MFKLNNRAKAAICLGLFLNCSAIVIARKNCNDSKEEITYVEDIMSSNNMVNSTNINDNNYIEKTIQNDNIINDNYMENTIYNTDDNIETYTENVIQNNISVDNESTNRYAYLLNDETVYNINGEIINYIEQFQKVEVLDLFGEYTHVKFQSGNYGYIKSTSLEHLPDSFVEVDITDQNLKVIYNNEIVLDTAVVTGNPNKGQTPGTDLGYTEIYEKLYNTSLRGSDKDGSWNVPVDYFFRFNDAAEGFHDMKTRSAFGGEIYKTNGSHGCVNMNPNDMPIMDEFTEVGTKVLVHK